MINAQAVRAWLEDKGITRCHACGAEDLQVSKDLYAIVCVSRKTGGPDLQRGSRVVRLRCGNCGNLMMFHARQMGLDDA
jgi:predicted RNA-binding Zn-ribbon protein involved in translation (DUF1610 family)